MNQSKLEVVKHEMARVNIDILGISDVKDIHLTLTVGLWQLEDVVLRSRADRGWGGEEKAWLSREILCSPYPEGM